MLNEKKGTCCHKCGHVHVKGTKCPSPFLKGERSCARRSLKEAVQTDHYQDRKKERGTILDIKIPDYAYAGKSVDEVKAKLIPVLQAKLNKRLKEIENENLGVSNNVNLGLIIFAPQLQYKEKFVRVEMVCGDGTGYHYLVITANNKLITMYPSELQGDALIEEIKRHVKEHRPNDTRPAEAKKLSGSTFQIDINGNEVREKEEKPEEEKVSEESLDYKVRTDYRLGATFDHKQYGPGKVVAAAGGGKAGTSGKVDWIEVKYDRPFMKGGKLQDTRRFENILTAAYFGKTLKKELHTMDHHGHDEHQQVRADVEETSSAEMGPIERFVREIEAKKTDHQMGEFEALAANRPANYTISEAEGVQNPYVKAFLEECDRIIRILEDDELFEKERQKYRK